MATSSPPSRTTGDAERAAVEARSIDYIPRTERHGKAWHLAPVWIAGNANLGTIALGFVGIGLGVNVLWTVIAVALGSAFGAVFSALHSTQGPHLGLPQLIQSRPQFGYVGALLALLLALFTYVGFNAFANVLAGQSLQQASGVSPDLTYILVSVVAGGIAFAGYDTIHSAFRWITLCFIAVFSAITIVAPFKIGLPHDAFEVSAFALAPFLIQASVSAGFQINWAIYVSDYTRYLPMGVNGRHLFWITYLGMSLSATWLSALGAVLALDVADVDAVASVQNVGDSIVPGFGGLAVLVGLVGLFGSLIMNMYGGSLTIISVVDCLRRVPFSVPVRAMAVSAMVVLSLALTYPLSSDLLGNLTVFLQMLLYLFAPWTAINLVDYFLVRRGQYSINEIFNRDGIYRRVSGKGLLSYGLGLAAQVPFMATTAFTGFVAKDWHGVDVAPIVGLAVAGVAYGVLHRRFDLRAEMVDVERLDAGLDGPSTST